jgi:hypothetical protein
MQNCITSSGSTLHLPAIAEESTNNLGMVPPNLHADEQDLELALHNYVRVHNQNPKPFIWARTATDILQKATRARKATDQYRSE